MSEFTDQLLATMKAQEILIDSAQEQDSVVADKTTHLNNAADAYVELTTADTVARNARATAANNAAQADSVLNIANITDQVNAYEEVVQEQEPTKDAPQKFGARANRALARSASAWNQSEGKNADGSEIVGVLGKIKNFFTRDDRRKDAILLGAEARADLRAAQEAITSRSANLSNSRTRAERTTRVEGRAMENVATMHGLLQQANTGATLSKGNLALAAKKFGIAESLLNAELKKQGAKIGEAALVPDQVRALIQINQLKTLEMEIKDRDARYAMHDTAVDKTHEFTKSPLDKEQLKAEYRNPDKTRYNQLMVENPAYFSMLTQDLSDQTAVEKLTLTEIIKQTPEGSGLDQEVNGLLAAMGEGLNDTSDLAKLVDGWKTANTDASPDELRAATQEFKAQVANAYMKDINTNAQKLALERESYAINADTLAADTDMPEEWITLLSDQNIMDQELATLKATTEREFGKSFENTTKNLIKSSIPRNQQIEMLRIMAKLASDQTKGSWSRHNPTLDTGIDVSKFITSATITAPTLLGFKTSRVFNLNDPLDIQNMYNFVSANIKVDTRPGVGHEFLNRGQ